MLSTYVQQQLYRLAGCKNKSREIKHVFGTAWALSDKISYRGREGFLISHWPNLDPPSEIYTNIDALLGLVHIEMYLLAWMEVY